MKFVVIGASGNIGSAVLREATAQGEHEVVAVARRTPDLPSGVETSVTWRAADVTRDDLVPLMSGADAVVHVAWKFQPTHVPEETWETNVLGTKRVLEAVHRAGVPAVVLASSIAAYSPAVDDSPVTEEWATDGTSTAAYCREKAYNERLFDTFEAAHPDVRLVRMRPAFVFQRSAASEQRRIFAGPLLRPPMLRKELIPLIPVPRGLRFQAVHAGDVGRAFAAAASRDVRGAFNLAADGLITRVELGDLLSARTVEVSPRMTSQLLSAAWHLRAVGAPGALLDALMRLPVLSSERARTELDWEPHHSGVDALEAVLSGIPERGGSSLPPLHR